MLLIKTTYLRKSNHPSLMIDGSNCKERKLSFRTLIGLRVLTSKRMSVLSMNPGRFPAAPGLWYVVEEESTECTSRATDANHREQPGMRHCDALGIFLQATHSALRDPAVLFKEKVRKGLLRGSSIVLLCSTSIDLVLSSCLVVSPSAPRPLRVFGSCREERTPRASLPGCESQRLGGGEEAAPPLRFFEI